MVSSQKNLSIVVPVYNEAPNLRPLYSELVRTLDTLKHKYEILFVDDGSKDDSAKILCEIAKEKPNVKVIQFARNFGKEAAVSAGLHNTQGDAAVILDADMQMPPSLIGEFVAKWERGAEVVVGVFASRNMQFLRRTGAKIFYKIMQKIAHTQITPHATDYRLLDREVIDAFNNLPERNRNTRGLIDWIGFERDYVYFEQAPRLHGRPTYSFASLVTLAVNSFTSYSLVPLRLAGYLGGIILALSIPLGLFMYIERFVLGDPFNWAVSGTFFLGIMIMALVGLVLACLGLISLYIAHIHTESIDRPLYIIRRIARPKKQPTPLTTTEVARPKRLQEVVEQ